MQNRARRGRAKIVLRVATRPPRVATSLPECVCSTLSPLEESRHSGISFFWPDIRRIWRPRPPLSSLCDFLRLVVGGRALWAARRAQQPCTSGQGLCAVCRLRRKPIHFAAVSCAPTLRGGGTRRHGVYLRLAPTRSRPAKQQSGRGTLVSIPGATINRACGSGAHASGAALGR